MSDRMLKPTVGRIVHFWPADWPRAGLENPPPALIVATREVVDDPPFATGSAADIAIAFTKRYRNHTWDQIAELIGKQQIRPGATAHRNRR